MVDELLRREENKALLDGLEEASARVERAREALADIERQAADALRAKEYMRQLQNREAEVSSLFALLYISAVIMTSCIQCPQVI